MKNLNNKEDEILDLKLHISCLEYALKDCCFSKTADAIEEEIIHCNNRLKELERS